MKKSLLTILFFILLFQSLQAQVNILWQTRYTSSGSNIDRAEDMVIDRFGNSYVTGIGYGTSGNFDYVTIKYNSAGVQQWATQYNGPGNGLDDAHAIAVDTLGNVYVTGWSNGGTTPGFDYATVKYNSAGVQQWATRYNNTTNGTDEAWDVAVDYAGNVYVTGTSDGTSGNGAAATTIKYNSAGVQQYAKRFDGSGNDIDAGYAIYVEPVSGTFYIAGYTYQSTTADFDFLTIKYNTAGTQQWKSQYNSTNTKYDEARDIIVDASGNVYVTGYTQTLVLTNYDYATVKYNSTGVQQWAKTYNGTGNDLDRANSVKLDAGNNVYVTGKSIGASPAAEDIVTIKYDNAGTQKWLSRYNGGTNVYDEGKALAIDANKNVYVTGYSNNDYATIKYDSTGTQQWLTKYNGTGNNVDQAVGIALDNIGNVIISGQSKGSGSNDDFETIKYCQFTANAGNDVAICRGANTTLSASGTGAVSYAWLPNNGTLSSLTSATTVATPTVTTTYYVDITNTNGCVDRDTVIVTVNQLPVIAITPSGPTTFCGGGSVTLNATASALYDYQWSSSVNDTLSSITASTSGTYSITVTDQNGCSSSISQAVTVNPLPLTNASNNNSICLNSSLNLTATGAAAYVWHPGTTLSDSTSANPVATPSLSTTYTVIGTTAAGCAKSDSVVVTVNPLPVISITPNGPTVFCAGDSVQLNANTSALYDYQWSSSVNDTLPALTVLASGTYTLTITDVNSCSSSLSQPVTVNPLPLVNTGNDTSICLTNSLNLTAGGAATYIWHPGLSLNDSTISNPVASPLLLTTYTVIGTSIAGCINSDSIKVTVNSNPGIPTITSNNDSLFSSPATAYQWYYQGAPILGATNSTFDYSSDGDYYVEVFNASGCSNVSQVLSVIHVGVIENVETVIVNVFPSPAIDDITVEIGLSDASDLKISLMNLSGQVIYEEALNSFTGNYKKQIDLKENAKGIYFLKVITKDGSITKKIIKE